MTVMSLAILLIDLLLRERIGYDRVRAQKVNREAEVKKLTTLSLQNGVDVKTLSNALGHIS